MSLRRALQSSRSAVPPETGAPQAVSEAKPWSRRAWPREQLRAHWPHLTIQQVELLKEVFQLFDTEDKGYFTKDDLFFVMEAMGGSPTPQELDAVMYELDSNGDSVVDFPEFLTKFLTATDEKELLSVFHQLAIQEGEGNDDRVLTLTALERSFQYVGERLTDEDKKYLEVIFRGADKDGNGRLDIKEFTAYLEKMDDELFMGQAGALGNLLAAANISGGLRGLRSGRGGLGGSVGTGASRHRSNGGDGGGDASAVDAGGSSIIAAGADADVATAMLTNGQLLAIATRALSGRGAGASFGGGGGGLPDDMESITSNQGGLRNSFLSKLTRRHRRSSVNSSTIAAIAGQLASMGVTSGGRIVRMGSMNSAVCMAAASLMQHDAPEGMRSASSAHMAMHPPHPPHPHPHRGPPPGAGGPGPAGPMPHFLVETSSVSALRGGGFVYPGDHSPGAVPATAPVALSRGPSFGDGAAAAAGGLSHHKRSSHPGWAPACPEAVARDSGGVTYGGGGGGVFEAPAPPGYGAHPPHLPWPSFSQMRSRSMSAAVPAPSAPALTPLGIPASLRDSMSELPSGSTSTFSPSGGGGGGGSGAGPAAQERQSGVHAGFAGRPTSGMRSPAASWQKASVIQEAPEEGDAGWNSSGASVAVAAAAARQRLDNRIDQHIRTSAPSRFGRLGSFPSRVPQCFELTASGGDGGVGGTASASAIGGDPAAFAVSYYADGRSSAGGGSGGLLPSRPMRLGSGGDGRLGQRIGGFMAAMFSRQRSLGQGSAAVAAAAASAVATPRSPYEGEAESPGKPSPSQTQLSLLTPPTPQQQKQQQQQQNEFAGIHTVGSNERKTGPAVQTGATSNTWGLAAGVQVAMGWLRRASSMGNNGAVAVSSGCSASHGNLSPLPTAAAAAAAAATTGTASLARTGRLAVDVPGSDTPSNSPSKLTSPAEIGTSPGTDMSGEASSLALLPPGAAAAVSSPAVSPSSTAPAPWSRPSPVSPSGGDSLAATTQPYCQLAGSLHSRASAPGASSWLPQRPPLHPHLHLQQGPQQTAHGLRPHLAEAAALPSPAFPSPAQVPVSAAPRILGTPMGIGPSLSLQRIGSTGGNSRLAVSSVRDSPPSAMPVHIKRQQSFQHHHYQHASLLPPPPLPPLPHRLSQQGLPQHPSYAPHTPRELLSQPPAKPDKPLLSPRRLSSTGDLDDPSPHFQRHQQAPPPAPAPPQPSSLQPQQQQPLLPLQCCSLVDGCGVVEGTVTGGGGGPGEWPRRRQSGHNGEQTPSSGGLGHPPELLQHPRAPAA